MCVEYKCAAEEFLYAHRVDGAGVAVLELCSGRERESGKEDEVHSTSSRQRPKWYRLGRVLCFALCVLRTPFVVAVHTRRRGTSVSLASRRQMRPLVVDRYCPGQCACLGQLRCLPMIQGLTIRPCSVFSSTLFLYSPPFLSDHSRVPPNGLQLRS